MQKKRLLYRLIIILLAIGIFACLWNSVIAPRGAGILIASWRDYIKQMVATHYGQAVLVFMSLVTAVVVASLPLTIPLAGMGGYLFGTFLGALYAGISAVIGAMIVFFTVRRFVGHYVQQKYRVPLENFNKKIAQNGALYLLSIQFLPLSPFFIINLLAGVSKIDWITFLWTTIVGITPGFLLYSYAGSTLGAVESIKDLMTPSFISGILALVLLSLTPLLINRFAINKKNNSKVP